ncbi:Ras GTPase-activating protein-binding protein 1 [Fasciola hepatica]|uniref:Ras GTPase-activating protein-binding protein 1 n=1 Tax=Fasciola hepatica TaxID=6192 RepID=A0A2H1CD47_FASHE|nr:Ras GTPase-activating protein-binding protein 1 [Fasciola hepatica]
MVVGDNNSAMAGGFIVSRMDPSEVLSLAGEFVVQYYTVMRKCPSGLHRFYKDDSSMIRENATVFGQKMIHEKIMDMNISNSRVGILRLDALRANGNSVLIQVSGEVSFGGSEYRRFMQSFVLCEQAPYDFYVLNDIFRYQDHVYGDLKPDTTSAEAEPVVAVSDAPADFPIGGGHKTKITNGDAETTVSSWENPVSQDIPYSKPAATPVETNETVHREEAEMQEEEISSHDHQVVQSPSSPVTQRVVTQAPSTVEPVQTAPQQPRSWAQMASKPPSHTVLSMQSAKSLRTSMPAIQNFDDTSKSVRPSAAAANPVMNPR